MLQINGLFITILIYWIRNWHNWVMLSRSGCSKTFEFSWNLLLFFAKLWKVSQGPLILNLECLRVETICVFLFFHWIAFAFSSVAGWSFVSRSLSWNVEVEYAILHTMFLYCFIFNSEHTHIWYKFLVEGYLVKILSYCISG